MEKKKKNKIHCSQKKAYTRKVHRPALTQERIKMAKTNSFSFYPHKPLLKCRIHQNYLSKVQSVPLDWFADTAISPLWVNTVICIDFIKRHRDHKRNRLADEETVQNCKRQNARRKSRQVKFVYHYSSITISFPHTTGQKLT